MRKMEKKTSPQLGGYLEALLASCPVAILATDAEGIIKFANKEAGKLTEREVRELIGESIVVVYESLEVARETNRKLYASGGTIHEHESRAKTKSGKVIPVHISATHLKDSLGKYIGAVGYFEKYRPWSSEEAKVKAYAEELEAKLEEWKDLGAPVFRLYPGLSAVVVVGRVDSSRFDRITSNLLNHVKDVKTRVVLIDLSAAIISDNTVANQVVKTIRTVYLLGVQSVLAGIQTSIAQAMEPLLTDVGFVKSFSSTEAALEAALNMLGYEVCKKE